MTLLLAFLCCAQLPGRADQSIPGGVYCHHGELVWEPKSGPLHNCIKCTEEQRELMRLQERKSQLQERLSALQSKLNMLGSATSDIATEAALNEAREKAGKASTILAELSSMNGTGHEASQISTMKYAATLKLDKWNREVARLEEVLKKNAQKTELLAEIKQSQSELDGLKGRLDELSDLFESLEKKKKTN